MTIQIISQSQRGAEVVVKGDGLSQTIHLMRDNRGFYFDKWNQRYDLAQLDPSPRFLAEWYGIRAVAALKRGREAYALIRSACRQACAALPAGEEAAA
jgi:hypothetical protein